MKLFSVFLLALAPVALAQDGADPRARIAALEREITAAFAAGDYETAAAKCAEEIALLPDDSGPRYNLACALSRLGRKAEALAALAVAVEKGFDDPDHMGTDPDLEGIRGEEGFAPLAAKAAANAKAAAAKLYDAPAEVEGVVTAEGDPENGLAWRLRLPPGASAEKPARLIVWLHPSGGAMNRAVEELSPKFAEKGYALLVATRKPWMGWSERDAKRLLEGTLPDVAKRGDVTVERPVLLGFSAGGQMAIELWMAEPGRFGGLVLDAAYPVDMAAWRERRMEGRKPPEDEAVKRCPILAIVGAADGGTRIWDMVEADWRKAGVPLTVDRVEGGRHEWLVRGERLTALLDWLAEVAAGKLPGAPPKEE